MKRIVMLLAVLAVGTACADTAQEPSYATALAAAQEKIAEARALDHGWTTFDPLLDAAADAYGAGDEAEAIRLGDEARAHAELAITQAEEESASWRDRVIK